MSSFVDWNVAVTTASKLVRPGPRVTYEEAAAVVAELRELAVQADGHVRAFTRLSPLEAPPPVTVVDRPGWVEANAGGFEALLEPLVQRLAERRPPAPLVQAVGSRVTGAEVGVLLAYLAGRVLGQYELFLPPGQRQSEAETPASEAAERRVSTGRLTLVAPNIVATERALGVDPHDFRLWVCLHEVTHRTQFTAIPWLRDHLLAEITAFVDASDLDPGAVLKRLRSAAAEAAKSFRGRGEFNLIEVMQSPEQRVVLDRISAVMTLVEGHGEYVMDGVGPSVVPTVAEIRRRFDARRHSAGGADRVIRRLLGIDMKIRQYVQGEKFVRTVVDAAGMDGFNRVWESAEMLPTKAEITDPARWLARADGRPAASA